MLNPLPYNFAPSFYATIQLIEELFESPVKYDWANGVEYRRYHFIANVPLLRTIELFSDNKHYDIINQIKITTFHKEYGEDKDQIKTNIDRLYMGYEPRTKTLILKTYNSQGPVHGEPIIYTYNFDILEDDTKYCDAWRVRRYKDHHKNIDYKDSNREFPHKTPLQLITNWLTQIAGEDEQSMGKILSKFDVTDEVNVENQIRINNICVDRMNTLGFPIPEYEKLKNMNDKNNIRKQLRIK